MTDEQPTPSPLEADPASVPARRRLLIGPFTALQVGALVVSLVVVAAILVALNTPLGRRPDPTLPQPGSGFVPVGERVEGLRVGDVAPELSGTVNGQPVQLVDLDGNPITLSGLRGRPVWINFWATWCPPCQEETPVLREMHEKYEDDGLALVAISVQETTPDDVRAYIERYDLRYTVGFDATSAVFHTYRAFGLPTQLFLDRDGVIRNIVLGPVTREQADAILAPLVAEASPS
jgi:cytochrome c biogenesis protein CcmG/thiol:disulfide interchange protein DsbE